MSLATIKARIKTVLEGVSVIGNVHARMVNVKDAAAVQKLLVSDKGRVHAWLITRESFTQADENQNQSFQGRRTQLVVHGFYAVRDEDDSEAAFDVLVDAVVAALNVDRQPAAIGTKLNATVVSADPPYLRVTDHREYAGTLCHHCEIVLAVEEDIQ